jgi:hypothetical protein
MRNEKVTETHKFRPKEAKRAKRDDEAEQLFLWAPSCYSS